MTKSETDKSSFINQLRSYGVKRIILSYDFLISAAIFIVLFQDCINNSGNFKMLDSEGIAGIITVTSAIFAIIIAAIAIILSFSGTKFAEFLRTNKKLHSILFTFWFCSATHLFVILLAFTSFIVEMSPPHWLESLYSALVVATFVYAMLQTFYAVSSVMRFAYFLEFYERNNKQ